MSDMINGIGARGPSAYGVGVPRSPGSPGANEATGPAEAAPAAAPEGFTPTAEARETAQDTQAGESRASEIFSAWGPTPTPSAGQLSVQGAENTAVNQVHGVQNGQHVGSQGPDAGFSQATVYSTKPPA